MSAPHSNDRSKTLTQVRRDTRLYLNSLRKARLERRAQHGDMSSNVSSDTSKQVAPDRVKDTKPAPAKIGKRGVRVRSGRSVSVADPAKMPSAPEALRQGAKDARAAAREAQAKIRAARQAQRQAAVQQRATVQAARKKAHEDRQARAASKGAHPRHSAASNTQPAPPTAQRLQATKDISTRRRRYARPVLTDIKGIGEAMSRRLEKEGITELEALIAVSPDALRSRLGPISALANVEAWQAHATELLNA